MNDIYRPLIYPVYGGESHYIFNGSSVPRVTEIISNMDSSEGLLVWANRLGFSRKNCINERDSAALKGTIVHEKIDRFLKGIPDNDIIVPPHFQSAVNNAFTGFIKWWEEINAYNTINIIMNEASLCCNLFGGTLDLLLNINGQNYIVDFKTSNNPSYRYNLQTAAYEYLLEYNFGYNINGWIILMLNKNRPVYRTLKVERPNDSYYMDQCKFTFIKLVEAYMAKMEVQNGFKFN